MREVEPGDRYLVIDSGSVEVTQNGRFLRTLGPGEGLGEIALLRPVPRTATVRATQPTTAYELGRAEFICAVTGDARALAAAEALADQRLVAVPT